MGYRMKFLVKWLIQLWMIELSYRKAYNIESIDGGVMR